MYKAEVPACAILDDAFGEGLLVLGEWRPRVEASCCLLHSCLDAGVSLSEACIVYGRPLYLFQTLRLSLVLESP